MSAQTEQKFETYFYDGKVFSRPVIERTYLIELAEKLGLDKNQVKAILVTPKEIIASLYQHDENGQKIISSDGQGVLMYEVQFPVAG